MSRILNGIVAVCPDLGIGSNGNLPWHPIRLNNEFKHFRRMTATPSVKVSTMLLCCMGMVSSSQQEQSYYQFR